MLTTRRRWNRFGTYAERLYFLLPAGGLFLQSKAGMQRENARAFLQQMFGPEADFREGQWEAIHLAANQRKRVLVVQRTGWGKSVVYFLAAKILRDSGAGPSLLISPLLSLMRNQLLASQKLGVRSVTIHSENIHEWDEVQKSLESNKVDLLMVSPERLANADFLQELLPLIQGNIGMFVVDEAHCISDWGHDFRPDYRRIVRLLRLLPPNVPVLCTTATANNRVVQDIQEQITHLHILRGPLVRRSLKLFNIKLDSQAERLAWLAHFVPQLAGNGIIYTLTVGDARRVAEFLKQRGIAARAYHADLEGGERIDIEQRLLHNQLKALVATVALGMGFDKPDLGFVIHFQRPGSVVAYYQQVGRAGRAVDSAYGILLNGREDDEIQEYFIRTAFPPLEVLESVTRLLGKSDVLTLDQICGELNYSRSALEKALKLLQVEGAVQHDDLGYVRTANRWKPDTVRYESVTRHRRNELEEIKRYVQHAGCLMEFLSRSLDDPSATRCGKCMNCTGKTSRQIIPAELIRAATDFLRQDSLVLEPRRYWPKSLLKELEQVLPEALDHFKHGGPKMLIPQRVRPSEGRILSIYGDAGWGTEVARGKYGSGRLSDALVKAAADIILTKWKPDPAPQWITAVPSQRHAELVRDFAERLAAELRLPFVASLKKRRSSVSQKEMANSPMQLRNVLKAFQVVQAPSFDVESAGKSPGSLNIIDQLAQKARMAFGPAPRLPSIPVLLIDDVVDSGWTLTLVSVLLRLQGSGPVYPFALAKASPRGS